MRFLTRTNAFACMLATLLLAPTGCLAPKRVRLLGSAIAVKGQSVSSSALAAYDDISQQHGIDKSQQDFIKIVTEPLSGSAPLPDSHAPSFDEALAARIKAYRTLLQCYATFQALTDGHFGSQANDAVTSLLNSVNALKAVPPLPGSLTSTIPSVAELLIDAEQAKQVRKRNEALVKLTKAYRDLWTQDLPKWEEYLTAVYKNYADAISSLETRQFDQARLGTAINEPFSTDINVRLYKLQQRDAALSKRDAVLNKLREVDQAFYQLESAQTELTKAKPNISDAIGALTVINSILSNVNK